jgi:hypothetical protein
LSRLFLLKENPYLPRLSIKALVTIITVSAKINLLCAGMHFVLTSLALVCPAGNRCPGSASLEIYDLAHPRWPLWKHRTKLAAVLESRTALPALQRYMHRLISLWRTHPRFTVSRDAGYCLLWPSSRRALAVVTHFVLSRSIYGFLFL